MISAVSSQGKVRFMIYQGTMNQQGPSWEACNSLAEKAEG